MSIATLTSSQHDPVLIRLPNWVGDVCMSLPILDLFEANNIPYALAGRTWAEPFLSGYPSVGFCTMTGKLMLDAKTVRERRQQQSFRRGLILPDSLSSAIVFRAAGLKSTGYRDDDRGFLLDYAVEQPTGKQHAAEYWYELALRTLDHWGIPSTSRRIPDRVSLRLTDAHLQSPLSVLSAAQLTPNKFVLIAPTATGLHHGRVKVWPHFLELTQTLQKQGYMVVMCPPAAEREAAERAAPGARLLPPLSLGGFAALTTMASLVICNDSGVAHLAAAVGAPQITIFGVTNPDRTRPWTPTSVNLGQYDRWPEPSEVIDRALFILSH